LDAGCDTLQLRNRAALAARPQLRLLLRVGCCARVCFLGSTGALLLPGPAQRGRGPRRLGGAGLGGVGLSLLLGLCTQQ
jgi:hypothetical protein